MRIVTLALTVAVALQAGGARADGDGLYRALGGQAGIARIADEAVARFVADKRIAADFADSNLGRLRKQLAEQICALSGGPCRYTGHDMRAAHAALHVTEARFDALVEDMQDAMDAAGVGFATQNRLLALLAPMRRDVMEQ